MNMGRQLLKNMKKARRKRLQKKNIKSIVKRREQGKDIAKKMFGGEEEGGAG